jgi:hypothetical protein
MNMAALRQLPAGGDRGGFFLILAAILVAGVRDTRAPETMQASSVAVAGVWGNVNPND